MFQFQNEKRLNAFTKFDLLAMLVVRVHRNLKQINAEHKDEKAIESY